MSDPIDDAVEVITRTMFGLTTPSMAREIADDLHAAGLLVTPARDAAVAAKALREAAGVLRCKGDRDVLDLRSDLIEIKGGVK